MTTTKPTLAQIQANFGRVPRNGNFHVVPRYCSGSPAMVSESIAFHEATDECEFYEISLTGVWGEDKKKLAETKGLDHIIYARWERGKKVYRLDLITGLEIIEPKRLDHDDVERIKDLRNRKQHVGLSGATQMELDALEFRAMIHRQDVKS